jgi:hypothetical protein
MDRRTIKGKKEGVRQTWGFQVFWDRESAIT